MSFFLRVLKHQNTSCHRHGSIFHTKARRTPRRFNKINRDSRPIRAYGFVPALDAVGDTTKILDIASVGEYVVDTGRVTADVGQSFATGEEWYNLLAGRYGAENVAWESRAAEGPLAGTALARQLGQEGEAAVGIAGPKVGLMMPSGIRRFPDNFDESANVLTEVKNVARLSHTQQLRDYAAYAQQNGVTFNLFVRPSTKMSGPLRAAIANEEIFVYDIPGAN